jgi:hypothetical protein
MCKEVYITFRDLCKLPICREGPSGSMSQVVGLPNNSYKPITNTAWDIMATSFSGGRSRSTRREPPTTGKQLVKFITCCCESSAPFFVIYKASTNPRHIGDRLVYIKLCSALVVIFLHEGLGWLNELGSWITYQLIQAYHQYGVGSRPAL